MLFKQARLKALLSALALLAALARSEEKSIMTNCALSDYNVMQSGTVQPYNKIVCDGGFKTYVQTENTASQEITMTLTATATIVSVFVSNEAVLALEKPRFGTQYRFDLGRHRQLNAIFDDHNDQVLVTLLRHWLP